jgi:hypothetical protein
MAEPTTVDPRAGTVPAPVVKLRSLEFKSDHQLLKGCKEETGWKNEGAPCPSPEWTPGAAYPVSITMDRPILVRLTVEPPRSELRAAAPAVQGAAPAGLGSLQPLPGLRPDGGSFEMASSGKIEQKIQKLDLTVRWSAAGAGGAVSPATTSNVAYVTMGRPMDGKQRVWAEDGVSVKRMDRAVSWVASLGTLDPHQIVSALMAKFPSYTLKPSPKVPREYRHPTYFNDQGGAWAMSDYVEETGECQAIVRLVRGMLRQLGIPGRTRVVAIWGDPDVGGGRTVLSANLERRPSAGLDTTRVVNGQRWIAALVDGPVQEGKTYPASHTVLRDGTLSPGLNRFEACLKFTQGGKTRYYAGGAGVAVYENVTRLLEVFWGLVWVSSAADDGFRVEKIVARYGAEGGVA